MFNHMLTHTESLETPNMSGLTYVDDGVTAKTVICQITFYGEIVRFENVVVINPTWFWLSKMLDCVFFQGENKFGGGRYNPFTPTMCVCIWSVTRTFNTTTCNMTFETVLDLKFDLEDSRPCFRHSCASPDHYGPLEHIRFRIFSPWSSPPCLDHQNRDF